MLHFAAIFPFRNTLYFAVAPNSDLQLRRWDGAEPRRALNATALSIARECVDCEFIEMRGTAASNCVEMRCFLVCGIARICDSQNAWKCAEPRLAWKCELRVCPRTAARVRGMRVGSAREVRFKCGSSARSRGSAHWWVPYLYVKSHSDILRVNIIHKISKVTAKWTLGNVKVKGHYMRHTLSC